MAALGVLSRELISRAFKRVDPYIRYMLQSGRTKRPHLALCVTATEAILPRSRGKNRKNNILFTASYGNKKEWEFRFDKIAQSKAEKSARTGKPSADLPPHYLRKGDTIFWGSVVLDDIVVGFSGTFPFDDEMFSMWLAAAIKAEAKKFFEAYPHKDKPFLEF